MTEREQRIKNVMDAETQLKWAIEELPDELRKTVGEDEIETVLDEQLEKVTEEYGECVERGAIVAGTTT